jgi:shikimate kinase
MGCGKSTLGKKLANELNFKFVDLDDYIESESGKTIAQLFNALGEEGFRKLETKAVETSCNWENTIIATGGGAPCFHSNMQIMNASGITVYIKLSPEQLTERLEDGKAHRPLLKGKSQQEVLAFIEDKLKQRESFYKQAQYTIEGLSISTQKVVEVLQLSDM